MLFKMDHSWKYWGHKVKRNNNLKMGSGRKTSYSAGNLKGSIVVRTGRFHLEQKELLREKAEDIRDF